MEEVRRIMAELDWSPLWISMKTGVVATVISFFLGIYAARKSVQAGPRLKAVLDGILTCFLPRLQVFSCCSYSACGDRLGHFYMAILTSKSYSPGPDV